MHVKEINIKNHVCICYFNNSIKAKKLETKNILIDEGTYQELLIFSLDMFTISR